MPWTIEMLPHRQGEKAYKRYPDGQAFEADAEDLAIHAHVQALELLVVNHEEAKPQVAKSRGK